MASNYTFTTDELDETLKAYPHLVSDSLSVLSNNEATNAVNTQSSLVVSLRDQARYNDVSKTRMLKLVTSLVKHNRLVGWVSKRKHGFVKAGAASAAAAAKPAAKPKNKGGRLSTKQQIQKEERTKALSEYRQKVRKQMRKQYGLD